MCWQTPKAMSSVCSEPASPRSDVLHCRLPFGGSPTLIALLAGRSSAGPTAPRNGASQLPKDAVKPTTKAIDIAGTILDRPSRPRPCELVFVDDHPIGVDAARSRGMTSILFTTGEAAVSALDEALHD